MSFVLMALLVIIVGYGGMRVSSGALTTGELVAFIKSAGLWSTNP